MLRNMLERVSSYERFIHRGVENLVIRVHEAW